MHERTQCFKLLYMIVFPFISQSLVGYLSNMTTKNMSKELYLIPIEVVNLTCGYRNCVVIDSCRNRILSANRSLYDFFLNSMLRSRKSIYSMYAKERETLEEYLDFLFNNEIAFWGTMDELHLFSAYNNNWDYPSHITNAIVSCSTTTCDRLSELFGTFSQLCVEAIELYVGYGVEQWPEIIKRMNKIVTLKYVKLFVPFNQDQDFAYYDNIIRINPVIDQIIIYSSPQTRTNHTGTVINILQPIDFSNCGLVDVAYFCHSIPFFTESQRHNTCLNRKICIDAEGYIKNCPAMARSYGNIKDTTLEEAINKPGFKDLWYICKDQIDVCKDCEFRYMCTDCRCFIKDPDNIYSQPAKCTYNPYICLWEGQDGYVPVEECGTYSRETGFVPDKKRIAELNKRIWGEE